MWKNVSDDGLTMPLQLAQILSESKKIVIKKGI